MKLVEAFAGTAAVVLHLLGGRPLTAYMGGKQRFARGIVAALEMTRPTHIVLNDAGPWGRAWAVLAGQCRWHDVAHTIESLAVSAAGVELFRDLAGQPPPVCDVEWTAVFLMLQSAAANGKPVADVGDRWKTAGYAHLSNAARARGFVERLRPDLLAARVRATARLDWPTVEVHQFDVASGYLHTACPAPDVAYLDPHYHGTSGYAHTIGRAALYDAAMAWWSTGALVGVSEAEPLPWVGWSHRRLAPGSICGGGPIRLRSVDEWLTVSAPPATPGGRRGRALVQEVMPW